MRLVVHARLSNRIVRVVSLLNCWDVWFRSCGIRSNEEKSENAVSGNGYSITVMLGKISVRFGRVRGKCLASSFHIA